MINLTIREKEDLKEVYDCLVIKSEIELSCENIYQNILNVVKKIRSIIKM